MEEIDQALDDLVQLAKPPVQLALPGHVLKSVHQHLETWKRDLLSRLGPPDPDFAEQVTAYHKWFHQSLAEHHDIYVALVSPVLPQSAGAALTAFLYQLATRFSDFVRPLLCLPTDVALFKTPPLNLRSSHCSLTIRAA